MQEDGNENSSTSEKCHSDSIECVCPKCNSSNLIDIAVYSFCVSTIPAVAEEEVVNVITDLYNGNFFDEVCSINSIEDGV